jgi:hypothetical protein
MRQRFQSRNVWGKAQRYALMMIAVTNKARAPRLREDV